MNLSQLFKKTQPESTKETLSLADKLFIIGGWLKDGDGNELWDVLGALRGPDMPKMCHLKEATSALIRYRAFGVFNRGVILSDLDFQSHAEIRRSAAYASNMSKENEHFVLHAFKAFQRLGLSWRDSNGRIVQIGTSKE